jgi:hypothetical protein
LKQDLAKAFQIVSNAYRKHNPTSALQILAISNYHGPTGGCFCGLVDILNQHSFSQWMTMVWTANTNTKRTLSCIHQINHSNTKKVIMVAFKLNCDGTVLLEGCVALTARQSWSTDSKQVYIQWTLYSWEFNNSIRSLTHLSKEYNNHFLIIPTSTLQNSCYLQSLWTCICGHFGGLVDIATKTALVSR